eukprot:NODE_13993_length_1134_cov_11.154916.p1 GENE.NODE_13993_length_1134_cov_11.154916~~NODE_13993_length_1134_cov_11.154916.p1  ORF type:complete len:296 (-),score=89.38 NODE_13993_length_1134_cov_11.154916:245-1030(-)
MEALSKPIDDIISVNAGGTTFQSKRSTLCFVEDSMLSSMFSGRWDGTLPTDAHGVTFLDVSPGVFEAMLSELRALTFDPASVPAVVAPGLQAEMAAFRKFMMLEGNKVEENDYTVVEVSGQLKCRLGTDSGGRVQLRLATVEDAQRILMQRPEAIGSESHEVSEPREALSCFYGERSAITVRFPSVRRICGATVRVNAPFKSHWVLMSVADANTVELYNGSIRTTDVEDRMMNIEPVGADTLKLIIDEPAVNVDLYSLAFY